MEIFLPFLAVLSIIIFTFTAYTMTSSNIKHSEFQAGRTSKYLINVYDEAENALFYIEESVKQASKDSLKTLCSNGGYHEKDCKKEKLISGKEYVLWNSCPKFNSEEHFKEQLELDIKKYLFNYRALYEDEHDGFTDSYTELVKNLNINLIEDNKLSFSEIIYYIEFHRGSVYKVTPEIYFEMPDLNIFRDIYNSVILCSSVKECTNKISKSRVVMHENKLYFNIDTDICEIRFAVDKSQELQGKESVFSR